MVDRHSGSKPPDPNRLELLMKDIDVTEAQLSRVLSFFSRVDTKVGGLFTVNSAILAISAANVQAAT